MSLLLTPSYLGRNQRGTMGPCCENKIFKVFGRCVGIEILPSNVRVREVLGKCDLLKGVLKLCFTNVFRTCMSPTLLGGLITSVYNLPQTIHVVLRSCKVLSWGKSLKPFVISFYWQPKRL